MRMLPFLPLLASCGIRPMDAEKVCLDVGVTISNKVYECTGDEDLANQRYDAFEESYTCIVAFTDTGDPWPLYACARLIRDLSCDEYSAVGDDLSSILGTPECTSTVTLPGGWSSTGGGAP